MALRLQEIGRADTEVTEFLCRLVQPPFSGLLDGQQQAAKVARVIGQGSIDCGGQRELLQDAR